MTSSPSNYGQIKAEEEKLDFVEIRMLCVIELLQLPLI